MTSSLAFETETSNIMNRNNSNSSNSRSNNSKQKVTVQSPNKATIISSSTNTNNSTPSNAQYLNNNKSNSNHGSISNVSSGPSSLSSSSSSSSLSSTTNLKKRTSPSLPTIPSGVAIEDHHQDQDHTDALGTGNNNEKGNGKKKKNQRRKNKKKKIQSDQKGIPRRSKVAFIQPDILSEYTVSTAQSSMSNHQKEDKIQQTKSTSPSPSKLNDKRGGGKGGGDVVGDQDQIPQSRIILPQNQYECVLKRRAIMKVDSTTNTNTGMGKTATAISTKPPIIILDKSNNFDRPTLNAERSSSDSQKITRTTSIPKVVQRRKLFSLNDVTQKENETDHHPKNQNGVTTNESVNKNNNNNNNNENKVNDNHPKYEEQEEIYGDTTLGMKLTILSGKVIVQNLISLQDGRASPAQLSGMISRGDVILGINGQSLVLFNSNITLLAERLSPLSSPANSDGSFNRCVTVRFEIGTGFKLLQKDEDSKQPPSKTTTTSMATTAVTPKKNIRMDGAGELFNLSNFALVDQWSGQPFFQDEDFEYGQHVEDVEEQTDVQDVTDHNNHDGNTAAHQRTRDKNGHGMMKHSALTTSAMMPKSPLRSSIRSSNKTTLLLDNRLNNIGYICGVERFIEVMKISSGYFLLNDQCSPLLRPDETLGNINDFLSNDDELNNKSKEMELRMQALIGAKLLMDEIEFGVKKRKKLNPLEIVRNECRSFSSKSRFSQRSRFSRRKKHHFMQSSNVSSSSSSSSDSSDDEDGSSSVGSLASDDLGDNFAAGDEMLLKLAVWNKPWKKQMVEDLEEASIHKGKGGKQHAKPNQKLNKSPKKEDNLERQLKNLFFGEGMTDIMSQKKTTALPPDEITEVLYDLAISVTSTVPLNVDFVGHMSSSSVFNSSELNESSVRPNMSRTQSEIIEATRFLLDDIIPSWLNTFRPIKLKQRRVLWPLNKDGSSVGTPDDLSASSSATGWSGSSPDRKKEKLEDRIASLELDPDTRAETCHLATFYFKRKILHQMKELRDDVEDEVAFTSAEDIAVEFIEKLGAYLNLYEALNAASDYYSKKVVEKLLEVASHDPCHIETMRIFVRNGSCLVYEPKVLSCLLTHLPSLAKETKMKQNTLSIIVSAYPDLKPWQIRTIALSFDTKYANILTTSNLELAQQHEIKFYYEYLSLLMDSSDLARFDQSLVEEWCFLSTSLDFDLDKENQKKNFLKVASKSNSGTNMSSNAYFRDLSYLIEASDRINQHALTLELADEIITKCKSWSDHEVLKKTLHFIHQVAQESLSLNPFDAILMRQVLVLIHKIGSSEKEVCREIDFCNELGVILDNCQQSEDALSKEESLMKMIAEIISPSDALRTFTKRSIEHLSITSIIVPALRTCLDRSVEEGSSYGGEISGALLRIRKMRPNKHAFLDRTKCNAPNIWENVLNGTATIDK